ncbi:hypothetical protein PAECIP111892_01756 [Paenibacillus auburnensis]|uniref:Uncharacterized protein n=1 Tax=Paenibacillus auburnensis TaxID=2905649 RepID=A0ABM9BTK5_9BACL|nr:hypothetical protein [Paenibacillus auburnensis]CAH1194596.1 hypothetical protein PAECIP111892_01756 [Paenibacillus auburnensis]
MNFTVSYLEDQSEDPTFLVLVENVPQGSRTVSGVVTYTHDRMMGRFDFGELTPIIEHWRQVEINVLKNAVRSAIFGQ